MLVLVCFGKSEESKHGDIVCLATLAYVLRAEGWQGTEVGACLACFGKSEESKHGGIVCLLPLCSAACDDREQK